MNILTLSLGVGQYQCVIPIEEELIKRNHQVISYFGMYGSIFYHGREDLNFWKDIGIDRFDLVLATDMTFIDILKQSKYKPKRLVGMNHGLALKDPNWLDKLINSDVNMIFESGSFYLNRLSKFTSKDKLGRVKVLGFPKVDYLLRFKEERVMFKKILKRRFDFNHRPIVFYASTFSHTNKPDGTLKNLNKFLQMVKYIPYNFIIGLHTGDLQLINLLTFKLPINVRLCFDFNKNSLILGSDIVMTDNSSIGYEAALIDKPIIHAINDGDDLVLHPFRDKRIKDPIVFGHIIHIPSELKLLEETINDTLENLGEFDNQKRIILSEVCSGVTGKDTIKYVDEIEKYHATT